MNEQWKIILESKRRERSRLAALPFSEKIMLLEKMRDRALATASNPLYGGAKVDGGRGLLLREKSPDKLQTSAQRSNPND